MLFGNALGHVAAAAVVNKRGTSACPSALVIDDFSTWTSYANNLGGATSGMWRGATMSICQRTRLI